MFDGEQAATETCAKMFGDMTIASSPHRGGHAMNLACLAGTFEVNPDLPDAFRKGVCGNLTSRRALGRLSELNALIPNMLTFSTKVFDEDDPYTSQDFLGNAFQLFTSGISEFSGTPEEITQMLRSPFGDVVSFAKVQCGHTDSDPSMEPDVPMSELMRVRMSHHGMLQTDADATSKNVNKKQAPEPTGFGMDVSSGHPINWANEGSPIRGLRFWMDAPLLKSSCFQGKAPGEWATCLSTDVVGNATKQMMSDNGGQLVVSIWGQLQGCGDEIESNQNNWKSTEIAQLGTFKFDSLVSSAVCETAGFTPWNHHPDHRPLSSMGRARESIYARAQQLRRDANANYISNEMLAGAVP